MTAPAPRGVAIRDPVHGYLRLAPHERLVVDDPITQRLRNVAQTGLAQMVFPEANTSRFVHSLGAMHLASRFLLASVENAKDSTSKRLFTSLEKHLVRPGSHVLEDFDQLLLYPGGHSEGALLSSRLAPRTRLPDPELVRRRRLLVATEAALRLAALFHDLGHLPFSHDLEFAFNGYASARPAALPKRVLALADQAPHEQIGHLLAKLLFDVLLLNADPCMRAVYGLAFKILDRKSPYNAARDPHADVLDWLHSLIDGEVDVDRADYLLRDGRAFGFEFAQFDLERLIDHLTVHHSPATGFVAAVLEPGLSALESFFLSRARSAQAMIRHHKNAQLGAALRYASLRVFVSGNAQPLLDDLDTLMGWTERQPADGTLEEKRTLLDRYAAYDDAWWTGLLRSTDFSGDPLGEACRELVLHRRKTLVSVWKRKGELTAEEIQKLNALVAAVDLKGRRAALESKRVLVLIHQFKPYRLRPGGGDEESLALVETSSRGIVPAAKLSPLIHALHAAWSTDLQVHTFKHVGSTLTSKKILSLLTSPPGEVNSGLTNAV